MKVNFHYGYPINLDIDCTRPVDVYIDEFPLGPVPPETLRIVILQEPWRDPLVPMVQRYRDRYTHLLTYQEDILDSNPKARLFHFPNTWIKNYTFPEKEFSVSTVIGGKKFLEGHMLRHELWRNRDKITVPKKFYLSGSAKHSHSFVRFDEADYNGQLVLGASKEPLFDSMFHIAIENVSIANFFTEKLIDCFQTKTVPIYYGCKNIEDYFNTEGMFRARSISEIVSICNELTPDIYRKMLPVVDYNYELSHKWCDQPGQLRDGIMQILKEEGYANT